MAGGSKHRYGMAAALAVTGSLVLATGASAVLVAYEFGGKPIPNGHGAAKLTIDLDGLDPIIDVDALVRVEHPKTQQLSISLKSPTGIKTKLSKHDTRGKDLGSGKCFKHPMTSTEFPDFMAFDDEAAGPISSGSAPYASGRSPPYSNPAFQPRQPLSRFDSSNANGKWKFIVKDTKPGKAGEFRCARLAIED